MNLDNAALHTPVINFSDVVKSTATLFFSAYPRSFGGLREFSTSDEYRSGVYKLAIPYLVTAVVIIVAALIANFYFLARKSVVPGANDTRESDPSKRDCVGKAYLPFSCFLNLAIFVCIGISVASCSSMRSASGNAINVLDAARSNMTLLNEPTGRYLKDLSTRASNLDLDTVSKDLHEITTGVVNLLTSSTQFFDELISQSNVWSDHLDTIREEINRLSSRHIFVTVITLTSCILGLLLTFVCDVAAPESRCLKIFSFSMLLIPLAATWGHTAVSTWMAVATADFCTSTDQFYRTTFNDIHGRDTSIPDSNIFVQYQMTCPSRSGFEEQLKGVNAFLGKAGSMGDQIGPGLESITGEKVSMEAWNKSRTWMQDKVSDLDSCATQFAMAFRLYVYACGNHGSSGITAVAQLWLSSLGLSLLFTAIVAFLAFGEPPSEYCSARELMCIYGAPKLISAFGDIRSVLKRHSTFMKLEAGHEQPWNISPVSSDLEAMAEVAKEYNFDNSSPMSTTRPRRNAYTSHPLKDQKTKKSDWSLSHFGDDADDYSTDSSGSP